MLAIKIGLIISVILQLVAAVLAISMIKVAKFNISWVALTVAFLLIAARLVIEFFPYVYKDVSEQVGLISSWVGVAISILLTISLAFIKRLFVLIRKAEVSNEMVEKRILSAIINTEENEKQRFAKDLHDGLGPLLSNLKMSVSALEVIQNREEMDEILDNMKSVAQEAINSIKEVSNNLSPHILENFGLFKALEVFIAPIESSSKIHFELNVNFNRQRFPYNTEIALYRIITELINNTLKHAEATEVAIDILKENENLNISYSDNGKGTKLSKENGLSGQGLSNMQSRIKTLHGSIVFITKPNKGFMAKIVCPIQ